MKPFFVGMLILLSGRLFSQVDLSYPSGRWQEGKKTALRMDTLTSANRPKVLIAPGASPARMPTRLIENKGVYQYNNRRGFDVYSMKIDNMPCLTPDSTFQSHLPGADISARKNLFKRR